MSSSPAASFADLPGIAARALRDGRRRVAVVFLDAFGWRFVQRHASHPLLSRIAREGTLAPIASQFPSTTVAHVTTLHTGLPVEAHGLYEWRVLEPSVGRVVRPFVAEDLDGVDVRALLPEGPSFYQRLITTSGVPSRLFQPFERSAYDEVAVRGAETEVYDGLAEGARSLAAALDASDRLYGYLYFDGIDATGHAHGPSSPEFDDACLRALDAVYVAFFGPDAPELDDTLLLLTADHGQIEVSPDRIDDVDLLVPGLGDRLIAGPAGSPRDLFLHVAPEDVERTVADLSGALGDHATVVPSRSLFPAAGPRLLHRLAPICVLPSPGRTAWLSTMHGTSQTYLGHHGGRTPEESTTFLGTLVLGRRGG